MTTLELTHPSYVLLLPVPVGPLCVRPHYWSLSHDIAYRVAPTSRQARHDIPISMSHTLEN